MYDINGSINMELQHVVFPKTGMSRRLAEGLYISTSAFIYMHIEKYGCVLFDIFVL